MAMRSLLPIDELNALEERLKQHFDEDGHIASKEDCEDIIDDLLDLYLLALAEAVDAVNQQFGTAIEPTPQEVQETVYRAIDGATWRDRVVAWYATGGTLADIMRIAETETTRIWNAAALDTAIKAGAKTKTWVTMADWLVRDTHNYIHLVEVPIDAEFYTFDGDHAQAPGGFERVENNANCRCELRFK
jgi:hypothetical protein